MKILRLFAFLLLLISVTTVWAQDATEEATEQAASSPSEPLSYGVAVNGEITDANPSQVWTLQAASADRIAVVLERTDGNLIPSVSILDANGQAFAQSYGADRTGAVARIEGQNLPAAGTFQVEVTRNNGPDGVTTGAYSLTVIALGTADDNPNNLVPLGPVEYFTPVQGEITSTQWVNRYTLDALAADRIHVRAERVDGTLYPEVEIVDVNGVSLRTGYTDYTGDTAETDADLPNAGQYTVIVRRAQGMNGATTGTYELTVDLLGAGEVSPLLQSAGEPVSYDTPVEGQLGDGVWYRDYQLVTQANDTISVIVERAGGNLQPEVVLLGGSGQELRRGYTEPDGASAMIERYQLEVPGTYTIRVTRSQNQNGLSEGAYRLTVQLDGTGDGSPALNEIVGTVQNGTEAEGQISNEAWRNAWTYTAEDGESVDIVVNRTDGTLIPRVAIQDINGQTLREAYPEETGDVAVIRNFAIPAAGDYRIVVFRNEDQNGYTRGSYSLIVRPPEQ